MQAQDDSLSSRALLGICDSLRCLWVGYGAYWSVDIHLGISRVTRVLSLGSRVHGSPVAGTFSYFVSEGKCIAMFMSLACCWRSSAPRASHRVPCRAEHVESLPRDTSLADCRWC
jgi:hypothetical protein